MLKSYPPMGGENWFSLDPKHSQFFENNWSRFHRRAPDQAVTLDSFRPSLEFYQFLKIGNQQFACRAQADILYDPSGFHASLQRSLDHVHSFLRRGAQFIVLAGVGLGYLAAHLEEEIRGDFSKGLLLVENRPELILAQFCLFDCRNLLESPQILWAVAEDLQPVLETIFERESLCQLSKNRIAVVPERGMTAEEKKNYQQIGTWFESFQSRMFPHMQVQKMNFDRSMKELPDLEQGCIWAVATPDAYAHTPLIRSLLAGFETLGWKSRLLEIRDGFTTRFRVTEDLIRSAPDLLLTCNSASETFISREIQRPRICWILDNPRHYDPNGLRERLGSWDYVYYIDRTFKNYFHSAAARKSGFLPATSSFVTPGVYRTEFSAPMVLVGSYDPVMAALEPWPAQMKDCGFALLDYRIEHPEKTALESIQALGISNEIVNLIVEKARIFTSKLRRNFSDNDSCMDYYLYALANSWKRERYVRALLDRGIIIYGPESWLSVLGTRYASQYRGWLPPERIADVYTSAQICLNIHSLQCPTGLNPRDFDVLAAPGCLLSDYVEDMDKGWLEIGKDFLTFRTVEELKTQVDRLFADSTLRELLRVQGFETYRERHTPTHRAQEMMRVIKQFSLNNI